MARWFMPIPKPTICRKRYFFFSSRRRHTRSTRDWSSDVCSSDLLPMCGGSDPTNIGNPHEFTVRQLAELVLRLTGSRSAIVEQPLPTDDPKVRQPDIRYARETLDWEPRVPLEDGLRRTIEYFRGIVA